MVPADKAGDGSMASSLRNACKNWKCISYSAQMNGALDKMILNKVDVLGLLCIANTLKCSELALLSSSFRAVRYSRCKLRGNDVAFQQPKSGLELCSSPSTISLLMQPRDGHEQNILLALCTQ